MPMPRYAIKAEVGRPYDEVVAATKAALASEGFGVLTEIDVKATMKKKLDRDIRPYVILGACNPPNAFKVLSAEPDIGLMLPCNVVVYENEQGKTVVAAIDPKVAMESVNNPEIALVADMIAGRLRRVIEAVKSTEPTKA
jgi:uncharacterized protein (DUF302 family)